MPADVKRASASDKAVKISTFDVENPNVMSLLKQAHEARINWSNFYAMEQGYTKEAEEFKVGLYRASNLTNEATDDYHELHSIFDSDFLNKVATEPAAYNSPFSSMAATAAGAGQGGLDAANKVIDPIANKALASVGLPRVDVATALNAPKQRAANATGEKMRNIQRQLILEELMVADPVLKSEEPESVSRAYQTLIQVAPDISLNREVARSILRQSVQSVAVSPFDAKSWADLESEIRKRVSQGAATSEGASK